MKITARPVTAGDRVDQSRDVSGLNKWAQSSRTVSMIMLILGWFTIPAEVFLRRDFGQRWFTVVNFYAGVLLMMLFAGVQYVLGAIWEKVDLFIKSIANVINPFREPEEPTYSDRVMDSSMLLLLIAYLFLGSFHLFKIWWRNRTDTALHSFDDGTSRFEGIAKYFIAAMNVLTVPFVWMYKLLLPPKQRRGVKTPKLINDRTSFTNTVFEPLLLLLLAYQFTGIASIWLFLTALSVTIHANWKETARKSKILDFKDSMLDAQALRKMKEEMLAKPTTATVPNRRVTEPAQKVSSASYGQQYPDLKSIIDEMNRNSSRQS